MTAGSTGSETKTQNANDYYFALVSLFNSIQMMRGFLISDAICLAWVCTFLPIHHYPHCKTGKMKRKTDRGKKKNRQKEKRKKEKSHSFCEIVIHDFFTGVKLRGLLSAFFSIQNPSQETEIIRKM